MSDTTAKHIPVLLAEVLELLNANDGGTFLDGTFGGGGHTRAILDAHPSNRVVALDQDPAAAERSLDFKKEFGDRFTFHDTNFRDISSIPENNFKGILLDLGVSSFQLDEADRGFAFRLDGPADMRLDPRSGIPANEFLEKASNEQLKHALRDLGEERSWKRVSDAIQAARGTGKLSDTKSLADLISAAIPQKKGPRPRIHPATKSFQGIRMAINDELGALEQVLPDAFDKLAIDGSFTIITFHSLEDRMVKRFFRKMAGRPQHSRDNVPQDLRPVYANMLTRKAVAPSEDEISHNPRSRSSKVRAIQKTHEFTTP